MIYAFENFELDTKLYELRRDGKPCRMEPQVFDMLLYIVENRDRVVTKNDLFDHIWKNRVVTDSALASRLKAVRATLGDRGRDQRLIKTLHGRGFRFVGNVTEQEKGSIQGEASSPTRAQVETSPPATTALPGRETQQSALLSGLATAKSGARQIVFITGDAGFGKTTLLRSFIAALAQDEPVYVAHGQCLEHHGAGEAYMPILEAIARLCSEDDVSAFAEIMAQRAPTWTTQMPGLCESGKVNTQAQQRGGTQDRMLREMVETLEVFTSQHTLVLVLEDIHWSDPSTIDLVVRVAMRTDRAQLMVVATFRPANLKSRQSLYSTVKTLIVREHSREVALSTLDEASVDQFLDDRFNHAKLPPQVRNVLYQRTGGHPLFTRNVVEQWVSDGTFVKNDGTWKLSVNLEELTRGVPDNLRLFIEQFIEELEAMDRLLLEGAAVRGCEFTTAEVAAVLDQSEEDIESRCSVLASQGRWIHASGVEEWPTGQISSVYTFAHDLYQEVLYDLVPLGQRGRIHRTIGERLESAYGDKAVDKAVELANHFVQGRVPEKAVEYLRLSASKSLNRNAPREAITVLRKALDLVPRLTDETDRANQELDLQLMLAPALISLEGVGSKDAEGAFERARALCDMLKKEDKLQQVLYGMGAMYEVRGEFNRSQSLMAERMKLPSIEKDDLLRLETHELLACSLFHQGQFDLSLKHAKEGISRFDTNRHSIMAPAYGENPGISCFYWAALDLLLKGSISQAFQLLQEGIKMSQDSDQQYSLATAYVQAATFHQIMRDVEGTLKWAELAGKNGAQQGYVLRVAMGLVLQGWGQVMAGDTEEGIENLEKGIEDTRVTGACMDRPYFLGLLAEAYTVASRYDEGLRIVDEALIETEDRIHFFYASELHRLRGALLLELTEGKFQDQAESSFNQALTVAHERGAKLMELRVTTSLARLLRDRGDHDRASVMLEEVISGFVDVKDTPDLCEARRLMKSL
jgi:DNA-binding winged helix-turn-helix (wHTH) protein/tetratricopeptide (TPR) repeat protein